MKFTLYGNESKVYVMCTCKAQTLSNDYKGYEISYKEDMKFLFDSAPGFCHALISCFSDLHYAIYMPKSICKLE